jgi:hypothetical protein
MLELYPELGKYLRYDGDKLVFNSEDLEKVQEELNDKQKEA